VLDGLDLEATGVDMLGTLLGDTEHRAVPLDLRGPIAGLGPLDGIYIVVENMPTAARLSRGRCNSDLTWSLAPDELDGLELIMHGRGHRPFALTVRILTPDPHGYEFASTLAKFDLFGTSDGEPATMRGLSERARSAADWPQMVRQAYARHRTQQDEQAHEPATRTGSIELTPEERIRIEQQRLSDEARLATLRAEWQAEEDLRLERAREDWDAKWWERWRTRELELNQRHAQILAGVEDAWQARESTLTASLDAQWGARLAAVEACWRSGAGAGALGVRSKPARRGKRGWRVARTLLLLLMIVIAYYGLL
jgi:hypothetical protein